MTASSHRARRGRGDAFFPPDQFSFSDLFRLVGTRSTHISSFPLPASSQIRLLGDHTGPQVDQDGLQKLSGLS